jgi:hypothetical protein
MFCRVGTIPSTAVICCCSSVKGTGVEGTCVADVEASVVAPAIFGGVGSDVAGGEGGSEVG